MRWSTHAGRAPRTLLLGATPELAGVATRAASSLTAVDRSHAMLAAVFPAGVGERVVGDWRALPCRDRAFDWIVGDGCASLLVFPADYARLARELHRVLAPDGELVLRLFALPEVPESLAAVVADLAANRIGNFHILKWRLAMAIQPASRNVAVAEILDVFDRVAPDRTGLGRTTGWAPDTIATIDAYRGSTVTYSFPTVAEARDALAVRFVEVTRVVPGYELGDRCPTLVLRPR